MVLLREFHEQRNLFTAVSLTFFLVYSPVPHHNSDRYFSFRQHIFRKKCIHKSRSSPFQWPATLDRIFRTLSSSPGPYKSLTNMDVNQVWTAELRHIAHLLARNWQ